jgi:hypothetical protein
MSSWGEHKGRIIFGIILVIVVIVSVAAYQMTGSKSIENRYNAALGMPAGQEGTGASPGFSVEGNPVMYLIVLAILVAVCYAAYRHFKI